MTAFMVAPMLFGSVSHAQTVPTEATAVQTTMLTPTTAKAVKVYPQNKQGSVKLESLGVWSSLPMEGKIKFLNRIGRLIEAYGKASGYEACGMIWQSADGQRFAVPLNTVEAHASCVLTNKPPAEAGFINTGDSIHGHPGKEFYRVNKTDRILNSYPQKKTLHSKQRVELHSGFSDNDFNAGPGYLVEDGILLYQNGRMTTIKIGPIAEISPPVNATNEQPNEQPLNLHLPPAGAARIKP